MTPIEQLTLHESSLTHDEIRKVLATSIEQAFEKLDLTAKGGVQQLKVNIPNLKDSLSNNATNNQLSIDVPLAIAPYQGQIYPMHTQIVLDSNADIPSVEFDYDFELGEADPDSYNFKISIELPVIHERSVDEESYDDILLKAELLLIQKVTRQVIQNNKQQAPSDEANSANLLQTILPIMQDLIQQANADEEESYRDNLLKAALPIIQKTLQEAIDGIIPETTLEIELSEAELSEEDNSSNLVDIYFVKSETNDWEMHYRTGDALVTHFIRFDANGVLEPNHWLFNKDGITKEFFYISLQISTSPDINVRIFFDAFNISSENQHVSLSHNNALDDGKLKTVILNQQDNTVLAFYGNSYLALGKISIENDVIGFIPNDLSYLKYDSQMQIVPSSLVSLEIYDEFIKSLPLAIYEAETDLSKKEDIVKSFTLLAALDNFIDNDLIRFNKRYQQAWQKVFLFMKAPNVEFTPLTDSQYAEVTKAHYDCNLAVRWKNNDISSSQEPLTIALAHNKTKIMQQVIRQYQNCIGHKPMSPVLFSQKSTSNALAISPKEAEEVGLEENLEKKFSQTLVL